MSVQHVSVFMVNTYKCLGYDEKQCTDIFCSPECRGFVCSSKNEDYGCTKCSYNRGNKKYNGRCKQCRKKCECGNFLRRGNGSGKCCPCDDIGSCYFCGEDRPQRKYTSVSECGRTFKRCGGLCYKSKQVPICIICKNNKEDCK